LVENVNIFEDIDKMEIDEYLDSSPIIDPPMNEVYKIPKIKGDEKLPSPELKILAKELKYKFLDDTNKYPVIISVDLIEKEE
jgi:hypothetical protein